ncbi:hypothetical protein VNO77_08228 [Canavalia gladiata]|uniref:Uncharacterized protein n=1 Tax=Canavalia gladiata TaxID=3824 RepID=A0AAN9MDT4_CANGL
MPSGEYGGPHGLNKRTWFKMFLLGFEAGVSKLGAQFPATEAIPIRDSHSSRTSRQSPPRHEGMHPRWDLPWLSWRRYHGLTPCRFFTWVVWLCNLNLNLHMDMLMVLTHSLLLSQVGPAPCHLLLHAWELLSLDSLSPSICSLRTLFMFFSFTRNNATKQQIYQNQMWLYDTSYLAQKMAVNGSCISTCSDMHRMSIR